MDNFEYQKFIQEGYLVSTPFEYLYFILLLWPDEQNVMKFGHMTMKNIETEMRSRLIYLTAKNRQKKKSKFDIAREQEAKLLGVPL